ncbi:hypothetical protein I6F65_02725 [Pseudoalteromonas sp. SWXJZ94C]|uniref:hypothetical protein n=1 Tax=Pseudoalteromonas sp. SWXJZ94C TaxID=2792065 RepID=UPI0018CD2764|nr:hypothetical protein [Pseudoalteromonas sp. SWXJZ94C]MBH0055863.1 hypothetical protein [Pseudoalteromonas sp. SWXJZ94C]
MKPEKLTLSENIKRVFFFIFFFIITMALPFMSYNEVVSVLEALNKHELVFNEKSLAPSFILIIPSFAMLTRLLLLKVRNIEIEPELLIKWYKVCGATLILVLFSVPTYTYFIESKIKSEGYTVCNPYSSSRGSDVWVTSQSYCIKKGYRVSSKIIDWLQQQTNEPTPEDVIKKVDELLANSPFNSP